jgi:hypothetical protein
MIFTPLEIMPRCCAAESGFIIIPGGECPAGISNGVYLSGKHHFIDLPILVSFQADFKNHDEMIFGYRRV